MLGVLKSFLGSFPLATGPAIPPLPPEESLRLLSIPSAELSKSDVQDWFAAGQHPDITHILVMQHQTQGVIYPIFVTGEQCPHRELADYSTRADHTFRAVLNVRRNLAPQLVGWELRP